MKLCLSLFPHSAEEGIALLREHRHSADIIELRVDAIQQPDLSIMLRQPRPPVIITNRLREEGGAFRGTEAEAMRVFADAAHNGAEYIDVEVRWGTKFITSLRRLVSSTRLILSHHDFSDALPDIAGVYSQARRLGADIVKIAWMAHSFRDNDAVFDLFERARRDRQRLIAVAMGPYGQISRILPACSNGYLTYGAPDEESLAAPGQFTATDLDTLYRVRTLNRATKVFGLLGNPVARSKGIYFHNRIFRKRRLNAVYLNFLIDDLAHFVHRYAKVLTGASVTMPFKRDILRYLDRISDDSRELGAANTIIRKRASWSGSNTDFLAIRKLLKKKGSLRGRDVLILGTGATASAMALAASSLGGRVRVLGRSHENARALAERFNLKWAPLHNLENFSCDLLMNAIPVFTAGQEGIVPYPEIVPGSFFRSGMTVFDAVYDPPETPFLRKAATAGCTIISGLELFTEQARMQSKIFVETVSS